MLSAVEREEVVQLQIDVSVITERQKVSSSEMDLRFFRVFDRLAIVE